jgi:hypothetical protein
MGTGQGVFIVSFDINTENLPVNFKTVESVNKECADTLIDILQNSGKWIVPATAKTRKVVYTYEAK